MHLGIRADGAFLRPAADGDIGGQKRKAKRQHEREIDEEEQSAAVLGGQIREPPQIPDADGAAGRGQNEADLAGKMI